MPKNRLKEFNRTLKNTFNWNKSKTQNKMNCRMQKMSERYIYLISKAII